jgi:hypothetical protein
VDLDGHAKKKMPLPPSPPVPIPGLQASGLDIIKGAMRAVNILSSGRNPTAEEASDYLAILNQFLDSCNAERLMIFTVQRLGPFNMTLNKQFYTVGPGGDINIARPPRIEMITILWFGNPAQPAEIGLDMLDEKGWASIPVKNLGAALPQQVWDDGQFPLRTLSYWPYPTTAIQTVLYAWQALTFFPNLSTQITFPPGYLEFLRWNLAMRLDNAQITPQVMQLAAESKARIKSFNSPILTLQVDAGLLDPKSTAYNWISDQPVVRGRTF